MNIPLIFFFCTLTTLVLDDVDNFWTRSHLSSFGFSHDFNGSSSVLYFIFEFFFK